MQLPSPCLDPGEDVVPVPLPAMPSLTIGGSVCAGESLLSGSTSGRLCEVCQLKACLRELSIGKKITCFVLVLFLFLNRKFIRIAQERIFSTLM